ncbi:hypothetical protein FDI24_gp215 [Acidovorax phage ACP17]|uniref:Uncharacterized protein n=1 Tax=Acidovorax phage ACP17 TaxID=2010329 RepID=A0A218M371_9CAUD|nr:hypothetical protein FDI24_gp215 [Acidovorax phage ACP17]ASD50496.1 hypothetical protein [Acidovorax phage ACP17]
MLENPTTSWTCFHCDERFDTPETAAEHFGRTDYQKPACQVDIAEYRAMEQRLLAYSAEDTDLHRELEAKLSAHQLALERAEERGYSRGLRDAKRFPADLGLVPSEDLDNLKSDLYNLVVAMDSVRDLLVRQHKMHHSDFIVELAGVVTATPRITL